MCQFVVQTLMLAHVLQGLSQAVGSNECEI